MNYAVVAEFVVQSEAAEYISEAISIIKQWNPKWSPPFFMTDYSEAEQLAISAIFPDRCSLPVRFSPRTGLGEVGERQ